MSDLNVRILLGLSTSALALNWLLTSRLTIEDYLRNLFSAKGLVIALFCIIIFLQLIDVIRIPFNDSSWDPLVIWLGLFIHFTGSLFALWARFIMKSSWGPPAQHNIARQKKLVTGGPFSFSRNPIYIGLFIMFIGFELALGSYLILLAIPLFLLINKAVLVEEKLLGKYFGSDYEVYKKRVPRYLPFKN